MNEHIVRGRTRARVTGRHTLMVLVAAILCAVPLYAVRAQTPPALGAAGGFAVLFGPTGALTCTTATINGDAGCASGGSAGACTVTGTTHYGDALGNAAYADFLTAYAAVSGEACTATQNGTLAGLSLPPGVYCLDASAKTGLLTLNGPSTGVWIFKTESSAFTATNFQVVFADSSAACANGARVFWWSSSAATVTNTAESFMGTILAGTDITITGGNFNGQVLATGSVTLTTPASFSACTPAVVCPTITLGPATLPNPVVGVGYSQSFWGASGTAPYSYAVTSGTLPGGLTLSSGGLLSGTPLAAGTFSFTVTATDALGCTGNRAYIVVVNPAGCPTILLQPSSLPGGLVGQVYSQTVLASGGSSPYTFAVTIGSLPAGLSLSSGGTLSGIPAAQGTSSFTVTATDNNGCMGIQAYTLAISCTSVTLSPASLPEGTLGAAYDQTIVASGGTGPYTFAVSSGIVPPGLHLSLAGELSGSPTAAGTYAFTVTATDVYGCNGSRSYSLVISACPVITLAPASLPQVNLGVAYNQAIAASGGLGPYTYAVTSGNLPPGLSLSSSGVLSGTPTLMGAYNFTVTATASNACTGSRAYVLAIVCPAIALSPTSFSVGTVGLALNQTISASGGTGPYSFAVTLGSLPTGLTLSSGGVLSGTPATAGTFTFTVTATDANGCAGTQAYTFVMVIGPTIIHMSTTPPCVRPFKIFVKGSNFQPGIRVYIDGTEWYVVAWKNSGKIVLKGAIQAAVPPGKYRTFTFVNPDGGVATKTWRYVFPAKPCGS